MRKPFEKGLVYHIYNRGCNKEPIFFSQDNYYFLLRKMKSSRQQYGVNILAYCLMTNHYHFLVQQLTDRPLSDWIKMLFNGYVQAVNKQQQRSGTLFEGAARHVWVDNEAYFIHVARYIHLNPVEAGLVQKAEDWLFSNYSEWIGVRPGQLVDQEFVKTYFPTPADYRTFVEEYSDDRRAETALQNYLLD